MLFGTIFFATTESNYFHTNQLSKKIIHFSFLHGKSLCIFKDRNNRSRWQQFCMLKTNQHKNKPQASRWLTKKSQLISSRNCLGYSAFILYMDIDFTNEQTPDRFLGKCTHVQLINLLTLSVANIIVALKPHQFRYWDESLWVGKNHALPILFSNWIWTSIFSTKVSLK